MNKLTRKFFCREPEVVAKNLLGKILVRRFSKKKEYFKIIETEAYSDGDDDACHAVRYGKTKRTETLFGKVGLSYVYSVHINMFCFNFVAHKKNRFGGVLIRGVERIKSLKQGTKNFIGEKILGPARVCKALKIDTKFNKIDLLNNKNFYILNNYPVSNNRIVVGKRVNIDYAKKSKNWLWRFMIVQKLKNLDPN